jgi:Flp pilus assembly protein TadG
MRRIADQRGQTTVELVVLLPVLAAVLAALWQAVLAAQAVWAVTTAARAAARAEAVGDSARAAARDHVPRSLERGLQVRTRSGGEVRVSVRIPALPGLPSPGRAAAGARFQPQS